MELTPEELKFIRESLRYTLQKFQSYSEYPSYEFKLERIKYVQDLISKISDIIREKK